MTMASKPLVSVLVLVSERPVALDKLYASYGSALKAAGWAYEFIFAMEPGHESRVAPLLDLRARGEPIRLINVGRVVGEATLLRVAASRAEGQIFLSVPAYWRIDTASVPDMILHLDQGNDMVVARRWPRRDSWVNRLQNRVFHRLSRWLTGSALRDLACGVRAFRSEVLEEVPLYGDFNRFFPLLAENAGFRVEEFEAAQHPGDVSRRVYSPGIYLRRVLDLLGMFFLLRFTNKPLRFFGLVGSGLSIVGGGILLVLLVQRLGGQGIAGRPMLLLGVLLLALGVQAVALGLIGEIIVFLSSHEQPPYRIASESALPEGAERQESVHERI